MERRIRSQRGFTLAELLIVVAIISVLATVVLMNLKGGEVTAKEAALRQNLDSFRKSLQAYHSDHGFFPCSPQDDNSAGNLTKLKRQLLWYSNTAGRTSQTKTNDYRYGPYVQKFPDNPFYIGTDKTLKSEVVINTTDERLLETVQAYVAAQSGNNGWYYEARSGLIVPNLGGGSFPDDYVSY